MELSTSCGRIAVRLVGRCGGRPVAACRARAGTRSFGVVEKRFTCAIGAAGPRRHLPIQPLAKYYHYIHILGLPLRWAARITNVMSDTSRRVATYRQNLPTCL